jgi:hypothetical protein
LYSVANQTNSCWRAIVVHSDATLRTAPALSASPSRQLAQHVPKEISEDPRFLFLEVACPVEANFGGAARNMAFQFVDTRWVGMIDDDDVLDHSYVSYLIDEEQRHPDASCVLFRMYRSDLGLVPPAHGHGSTTIENQQAGISFALKHDITKNQTGKLGLQFQPGYMEDYVLLTAVLNMQLKLVISPRVAYFVHGKRPEGDGGLEKMLQREKPERAVLQWTTEDSKSMMLWMISRRSLATDHPAPCQESDTHQHHRPPP